MPQRLIPSFVLVTLLLVGCSNDPPSNATEPVPVAQSEISDPIRVALLGDKTRLSLLESLAADCNVPVSHSSALTKARMRIDGTDVELATLAVDDVIAHSKHCWDSDLAVIVLDARTGPLPVHREHILFARQMHFPEIIVVLTNSSDIDIDDPELLELEELEMRDLLSNYGWDGDRALVAYDSVTAKVQHAASVSKGVNAISRSFCDAAGRHSVLGEIDVHTCAVEIYSLALEEAYPLTETSLSSGEYTVILGSSTLAIQISIESMIQSGQVGTAQFTSSDLFKTFPGKRFSIVSDGHVAAVGVVTDTIH